MRTFYVAIELEIDAETPEEALAQGVAEFRALAEPDAEPDLIDAIAIDEDLEDEDEDEDEDEG